MNPPAKWLTAITILSLQGSPVVAGTDAADSKGVFTSAQLEGSWIAAWKDPNGVPRIRREIKMVALDNHHLKVQFYGEYSFMAPSGEPALNVGIAVGTASITSGRVSFEPIRAAEVWGCRISMTREGNRLVVSQQNECGFGSHVHADGTYHRESKEKPTFSETFWNEQ